MNTFTSRFAVPFTSLAAQFLCCANVVAGPVVEFESTRVHVKANPEQDQIAVDFKFKVSGDAPLKIADLEVGCKCLSASAEKAEYQPGESGEIKTIMEVGAFEGQVSKSLTLISNDSKQPQLPLTAVVDVPHLVVFEPQVTSWVLGDPPTPKKILVKMVHTDPIKIVNVSSTRDNFDVEIKVLKSGREYELTLTPESTATPALGLLSIETDCKIKKFSKRQAFFNVVRTAPIGSILPPPTPKAPTVPAPTPAATPAP